MLQSNFAIKQCMNLIFVANIIVFIINNEILSVIMSNEYSNLLKLRTLMREQ